MVGVKDGTIVEVQGMKEHPTNRGDICALPYNLPALFTAEGRLTHPMIRRNNDFVAVDWNEAVLSVADELNRIAKIRPQCDSVVRWGSQFDGGILSGKQTHEGVHRLE